MVRNILEVVVGLMCAATATSFFLALFGLVEFSVPPLFTFGAIMAYFFWDVAYHIETFIRRHRK
jgi:hypothetical protein